MKRSIKAGLGGVAALLLAIGCGGSSSSESDNGGSSGKTGGTSGSGGSSGSSGKGGAGGTTGGTGGGGGKGGSGTGGDATGGTGGSGGKGGTSGTGGSSGSGGSGGGITIGEECGEFTPCGGDVVGSWSISAVCGTAPADTSGIPSCDGMMPEVMATTTGGYTFNADGTVVVDTTFTAVLDLEIDEECAMAQGGQSAEATCTLLELLGGSGATEFPFTADCTYADSICKCHIEEGPAQVMQSGTYVVSGNQITVTQPATDTSAASVTTSNFCVDGGTLQVESVDTDGSTSILTLDKQ